MKRDQRICVVFAIFSAAGCWKSPVDTPVQNMELDVMDQTEAENKWEEYYGKIKERRISAGRRMVRATRRFGLDDDSDVVLSFRCFGVKEDDARGLCKQLAEDCEVAVHFDSESEVWVVSGHSDSDGVALEESELEEWVEFMCAVCRSYRFAFSEWTLRCVTSGRIWGSSDFTEEPSGKRVTVTKMLEQLQLNGVTDATSLKVEIFFIAPTTVEAKELKTTLNRMAYEATVSGETRVSAWSPQIFMSEQNLSELVEKMNEIARDHHAVFDGWGTSLPTGD